MRTSQRLLPAVLLVAGLGACRGDMQMPAVSIAAVVSSVTVDGEPATVVVESGAPPAENAAPVIDAVLPAAAINGGSFEMAVSSADPFSEVVVGIPGTPDYFRITLTSQKTSASIVVTLDPGTSGGPKEFFIAGGTAPDQYGPYVSRSLSVMRVGSGDVQVSVAWNSQADLDLHVVDPMGDEVYWGARSAESGGELDLDSNAACGTDQPRNENTVWPVGQAPGGTYIVRLDHWDACGAERTDYVVTIWVKGRDPQVVSGTFTGEGEHGGLGDGTEIPMLQREQTGERGAGRPSVLPYCLFHPRIVTPSDGTRLRRPAIRSARRAAFPATVERAMGAAFGRLPMGAARDLLVRFVGAVEPLYRTLDGQAARRRRRDVHALVTEACRTAEELAARDRGTAASRDDARHDLAARLQETVAALQRLGAAPADDAAAATELVRLLTVLRGEAGPDA